MTLITRVNLMGTLKGMKVNDEILITDVQETSLRATASMIKDFGQYSVKKKTDGFIVKRVR
jgi:hypothetical protein